MKKVNYKIKLKEPYKFEDVEYNEIDLSGIDTLRGIDLIECQNRINNKYQVIAVYETNMDYCLMIASKVINKPVEFFYNMPASIATNIKNMVSGFLLGTV